MAAPAGTVWSKTYSTTQWFEYQLGIYAEAVAESDSEITYVVDVYFRSNYKVYDNQINVFFNAAEGIDTAVDDDMTHRVATPSVNCPSNNGGWPAANEVKVYSTKRPFTKERGPQEINLVANVGSLYNYSSSAGGVITVLTSVMVPAYPQYTVAYDANGGDGAPAAETVKATKSVTVSEQIPTREGYTFLGWGLTADADVAAYHAGDTYDVGESVTLYALWEILTYTVTYDANGGAAAPDPQVKTYGEELTVPIGVPQFVGHEFVGWGLSPTSTEIFKRPGDTITENRDLILYAVWSSNGRMSITAADGSAKSGRCWAHTAADGWRPGLPWVRTENGWKKGV